MQNNLDDSFSNDSDIFENSGKTLLMDGDILVYKPCCIFTEDTVRDKKLLASNIDGKIGQLLSAANSDTYIIYLTTKKNFRDFIADDYKANRDDVERPVNLTWAKKYLMKKHGAEVVVGLEADDLLSINQSEDTIIWSPDKDLMQVTGLHLDDITMEVVDVDELGSVWINKKKKYRFSGYKGLMFQALVGDGADYIIGCGTRTSKVFKSGKRIGQEYVSRTGIGSKKAYDLLNSCPQDKSSYKEVVKQEYQNTFGVIWREMMEQQINLLFMVKEFSEVDNKIVQWTYNDRYQTMEITTGNIEGGDYG